MEKNQIEGSFSGKYDDYTVKMFTNFVLEFQECFSEFLSTEEVIKRIKENIFESIVIKDELNHPGWDAKYSVQGRIELKKDAINDEEHIKYLIFHEMLHAITVVRDENGRIITSGFFNESSNGSGIDEAMTEYLTQIRNKKCASKTEGLISGYRVIVNEISRLGLIVGEEELIKYYFNNPLNLDELLKSNNMNYDEITRAYTNLIEKDNEVFQMKKGYSLFNVANYTLHRSAESIFSNYSKALGPIRTLKDFIRKYGLFNVSNNSDFDCIHTMQLTHYKNRGDDVQNLINLGVPLSTIGEFMAKMRLDFNTLNFMYGVSKKFTKDKNNTAINLFEYYTKNPKDYFTFFAHNYGKLLDYFHEYDCTPDEECLYNPLRYPIIGALLREHPELDFSDISYDHIEESNSNVNVFIFWGSNNKKYAYNSKGENLEFVIDEDGDEILEVPNDSGCKLFLKYNEDGELGHCYIPQDDVDIESFMKNIKMSKKRCFSEKSDFEYWIKQGWDTDGTIKKLLDGIKKRMKKRDVNSNIDF